MLYYRYTQDLRPMSVLGHAMFTDDPYKTAGYGDYCWTVNSNNLVDFYDIRPIIKDTIKMLIDTGDITIYLPDYYDVTSNDNNCIMSDYDIDNLVDSYNPDNIVDCAGAWDGQWETDLFYNEILTHHDIKGIMTRDGAIVFDQNIIKRDTNIESNIDDYR